MNGHYEIEREKFVATKRGFFRRHGVSAADGNERDVRTVEFLNKRHIAEQISVAHMVESLASERKNDACRRAEIYVVACRTVNGGNERKNNAFFLIRTAEIDRMEIFQSLFRQIRAKLGQCDDQGVFSRDKSYRTDMVVMSVR